MTEKRTTKTKRLPVKEAKSGELNKLKAQIRRLKKENSHLKSELKTLERAFDEMRNFLKDTSKDLSLEALLKGADEGKSLKEIKTENEHECKKCSSVDVYIGDIPNGKILICRVCKTTERV